MFGLLLYQSVLTAQTPAHSTLSMNGAPTQIAEPAVLPDRLELVTGDAQPVEDATGRTEVVNLVIEARKHSNIRAQPYDLKTAFTALGSGSSDGNWQLQDTSPGKNMYRWTAQGPGYSAVNLFVNKILYSDRSADSIPIRLAQVRAAIFFTQPSLGPRTSIRRAPANLDGVDLNCILVSQNAAGQSVSGGRSWDEAEYCIDPKSLSVVTYSPIPGLYTHYDYRSGINFHDTLVPGKFTITQSGQTVIEARTVSVTDPVTDVSAFQPSGLNTIGKGPAMSPPWHYHANAPAPGGTSLDQPQIVVMHGMQSPKKGRLSDIELVASTNPSLRDSALQYASKWKSAPMFAVLEPGTTPQAHEVYLTLRYLPAQISKASGSGQ
jgi:hypothetical protein